MNFRRVYHRYAPQPIRTTVRRVRDRWTARDGSAQRKQSSEGRFQAMVRQQYTLPDGAEGHPMHETWLNYALDTNDRGVEVVRTVSKFADPVGKRHLDIGSAYGGTVLAFAAAGATSVGVEIAPSWLEMGLVNVGDHPHLNVELLGGDILSEEVHSGLGKFDIITCEHVIEHVSSVERFLDVLAGLLTDEGLCHLLIPNPFSPSEVASDGHYGLFGLTLLERSLAESYFYAVGWNEEYGVGEYCFTYRDHELMFRDAGLYLEQIYPPEEFSQAAIDDTVTKVRGLTRSFESKVSNGAIPVEFVPEIERALRGYMDSFEGSLRRFEKSTGGLRKSLGRDLLVQYGQDAWYVIAYKEMDSAIGAVGEPTV